MEDICNGEDLVDYGKRERFGTGHRRGGAGRRRQRGSRRAPDGGTGTSGGAIWRAGQNAPDLLPDYEASVGSMLKMLRSLEGRSEGDPRKIADVIVQLANSDDVPVRLILGVDAEKRVQQADAARASEAEKWRHLTVSTIFEDGRFDNRLYMAKSGINS